ncbi:MAG: ABC transporter permease, partial [Gammaproteobacteria bacterium]|nr:ABC transporter permease [Gammaproteobacteria bacterium]
MGSSQWANRLLLLPATGWLLVMLVLPLLVVVIFSFGERGAAGGYVPALTLDQYANLPARFTAFKNTLILAPIGTLAALLVAYPLAYFLALRVNPKWKIILLVMVIVPFWTS